MASIGTTPLTKSPLAVKKYDLKLTPQDVSLSPYETSVRISDGFETTVDWHFGKSPDTGNGFIFESEPAASANTAELEIDTVPNNVPVTINGEDKGFSPLVLDSMPEGSYTIGFQAPGYISTTKGVRLTKGRRLIVTVTLAHDLSAQQADQTATQSAQLEPLTLPSPSPLPTHKVLKTTQSTTASASAQASQATFETTSTRPFVKILTTPTGYLHVRSDATVNSDIVGTLQQGSTVPYLNSSASGWLKISFSTSVKGWVNTQYAELMQ